MWYNFTVNKKINKDPIQPVSGTKVPRFAGPSTFARLPEIRDVGNLAAKVGLNNCVVDRDIIKVGYKSIEDLFLDLKKMGETNAILGRRKGLMTRKLIHNVEKFYLKNYSDNKLGDNVTSIRATFELIFLYGTK